MNWPLAIARNRTALLAVVAGIVALLGGREPGLIARRLRNAALALLRPAEAAARRLIVIAARGLVVTPRPVRAPVLAAGPGSGGRSPTRPPAFRLFDPPKRYLLRLPRPQPRGVPRIRSFWSQPAPLVALLAAPLAAPPSKPVRPDPDGLVAADRLRQRVAALERALADLRREARRLSRRLLRRRALLAAQPGAPARSPVRLGRPPGYRRDGSRAVDDALAECHGLALDVLRSDTS
jgi:hypothetical protein